MTKEEASERRREFDVEVGRRVCAAILSMSLGVGMDYFYRKNLKGQDVGDFWIRAGRQLMDRESSSFNDMMTSPEIQQMADELTAKLDTAKD